jgi:hypothetical protein
MIKGADETGRRIFEVDLLPNLSVGIAGRKYRGSIWTVRGIEGHVAFGPYCGLPPGQSQLNVEVEFGTTMGRPGETSDLFVEALYGDVVFALGSITNSRPRASSAVELYVPAEWETLVREPRFEARITSHGVSDAKIVQVTLRALGSIALQSWSIPGNWLSLVCTGPAGRRTGQGIVALGETAGTVFYGPYRGLMPGRYQLTLQYWFDRTVGKPDSLFLEILKDAQSVIASTSFLPRGGCHIVDLAFVIPAATVFSQVPRTVEFRLSKKLRSSLVIEAMELKITSPIVG